MDENGIEKRVRALEMAVAKQQVQIDNLCHQNTVDHADIKASLMGNADAMSHSNDHMDRLERAQIKNGYTLTIVVTVAIVIVNVVLKFVFDSFVGG